jgi:MoaA/NifB/PqqE/SkfB family radical SAM enzyme
MVGKRDLVKLDYNVTNDCNFRCIHCCFKSGECLLVDRPYEKERQILTEFASIGGKRIDITGGEPLTRWETPKIIELSESLGIKTELVTNASLLTEKKLQFFKKVGLHGIAVSVDGSTAEIYNRIRRRDEKTYDLVLKNIRRSAELGFYTKVNTVVFNSNLADLENISRLAIDLGAKEHGFYYFSPIGRGYSSYAQVADPIEWLKIIREKLWKLKDQIKFSLETPIIEAELAKERRLKIDCFMKDPWHLQILPQGNVYPCAIMSAYNIPVGNIFDSTLLDLWNDPSLRSKEYYRKNIAPLMKKYAACVDYPTFSDRIRSGEFKFVCLCTKLKIEEIMR